MNKLKERDFWIFIFLFLFIIILIIYCISLNRDNLEDRKNKELSNFDDTAEEILILEEQAELKKGNIMFHTFTLPQDSYINLYFNSDAYVNFYLLESEEYSRYKVGEKYYYIDNGLNVDEYYLKDKFLHHGEYFLVIESIDEEVNCNVKITAKSESSK